MFFRKKPENGEVPRAEALDRDELLRNAFDRSLSGVGFLNGEGKWLSANKRLLSAFGFSDFELLNMPLRLMTHPDDRKREAPLFADLRSGRRASYTLTKRLQRKTGEFRTFRVHMLRISELPQTVYQCTIELGTLHGSPLELFAAALAESERHAVILCDAAGSIARWSIGAQQLFGFHESEVLGKPWTNLLPAENAAAVRQLMSAAAHHGFAHAESDRLCRDGSLISVRSTIIPNLQSGETDGFLEICSNPPAADMPAELSSVVAQALTAAREELRRQAEENDTLVALTGELRRELSVQLATVAEALTLRDGYAQLERELERRIVVEQQLRGAVVKLRASNADLTKKLRFLAGAVRKLIAARKGTSAQPATPLAATTSSQPEWVRVSGVGVNALTRQIAAHKRTGTLLLRSGSFEKRFVFDDGHLITCRSNGPQRVLGQLLVDAGVIDEMQRQSALTAQQETGMPFGSTVVSFGFASEAEVANTLRENARRELRDAATWGEVDSAFIDGGAPAGEFVPIAVDLLALLDDLQHESVEEIDIPLPDGIPIALASDDASNGDGADAASEEDVIDDEDESEGSDDSQLRLVGRITSKGKTVHVVGCKSAKSIPKKQRIHLASVVEAEDQGFETCDRCLSPVSR